MRNTSPRSILPPIDYGFWCHELTSQARFVRVGIPRRAMHASGDSPWHSSAKHHVLRACFPLMAPFRTCFLLRRVVYGAYVQRLMGYLYTSWWSTTFLLYASRHTGLSHPTMTVRAGSWALDRLRARSIAGLFPQPSSEPDVKLVASSGSPVSVSL